MKLPMKHNDKVMFEVNEKRSDRMRCPNCFSEFTSWRQYVDQGDGYGQWFRTSKPHCQKVSL